MPKIQPLNPTVPISAFNQGKAGQIFSHVKESGLAVVMKNNEPECVLLSPADYTALIDRLEDAELSILAEKRMKVYDPEDTISLEDICRETGIDPDQLDEDEVDLE